MRMRKIGRTRQHIKFLSCIMAVVIGISQPCAAVAAEQAEDKTSEENEISTDDTESAEQVTYIAAFAALSEEDNYFSCMYKPSLGELFEVFPETLMISVEGEDTFSELEVTWECEEDFNNTESEIYIFYPQWDGELYVISDSVKDSIEIPSITVEVPSDYGIIKDLEEAKDALQEIIKNKSILALVYLCDKYEVKESFSQDSATIHTVVCGQSVQITDVDMDEYGSVWYQVVLYQGGTEYKGYVEREYLVSSDEDFSEWEDTYIDLSAVPMVMALGEGYPDIDQFPASYQNALYALKEKHPNWIFVRMDTGLDWNTVISKEMGDKSLVPSSSSGSWQNGTYGQGWSYASEGILKYYMDPRNFLTDPAVFQFEQLTYNSSYHTTDAVQEILKSSFMASTIPGDNQTYAQAFTAIGQTLGISPFHLAARVLQEQGSKGTSALISGTYKGYEGYYNYFNVGASGTTDQLVVQRGLQRAQKEGWNTRYKSLYGGAYIIGINYILKGQDTLYLEKFNVSNGQYANFTHQYMQNIQAPNSEASSIRKAYNNAGALENSFVFKIPVYNNMPASACSKPDTTDAITLDKTTVSSLEVNKSVTLIPYVNGSKVDYVSNMTFTSDNTSVATVDDQGKVTAVSPGTATIKCTRSGANTASCTVTVVKANPSVSTPVLSPRTYQEGLKLSDITLPDGWRWEKSDIEVAVGTYSYAALYTPSDTVKYNTVTRNISFTVTKAIPSCKMPEKLEAKSGESLGNIVLPSGFTWESSPEITLGEAGEYTFYVSYNPDEKNYYTVDHIPIIVQVVGKPSDSSSSGSTSTGSSSAGSTSGGSISGGSGTSGGSTGNTSGGSTSGGSGTTSSGSTGTTSGGSTSGSSGTTSGGSTGTTSGGSTSGGSGTSSGSTGNTSGGSTSSSSGTTSGGSTGTTSGGSTSGGSGTSSGSTGSTSGGSTSSSSGTTSGGSTGNTSSGSTSGGSGTSSGSTGSTSGGSTSGGSGTTSGGSTGSTSGGSGTTSGGSTGNTSGGSSITSNGSANATSGNGNITGNTTTGGTSGENNTPSDNASGGNTSTANSNSASNNISGSNALPGNTPNSNASVDSPANNNPQTGNTPADGSSAGTPSNSNTAPDNTGSANTADGNAASVIIDPQTTVVEESQAEEQEETFFRPSVTIQMEDTTILTTEKLQMAKEQNFNLLLDMGGYVTWNIDVDSIDPDRMTEVDMGVATGTKNVPPELIADILNDNKYMEITLAHDGEFGFEAVLNIALDPANSGRYANLFYYNPETNSLEFVCDAIIDANGIASFRMNHASSYIIIVSDTSMSGVGISDDSVNPVTRWIVIGVLICMVLVIIGFGIFFYRSRKDDGEENEESYDDEDYSDEESCDDEDYNDEESCDDEDYDDEERYDDESYDNEENYDDEVNHNDKVYYDDRSLEEEEGNAASKKKERNVITGKRKKIHRSKKTGSGCEEENENREQNSSEAFQDSEDMEIQEISEFEEELEGADDWIEDEDWHEPEPKIPDAENVDRFADDHAEEDWIDDDEWNIENDWMDDEEWEKKNLTK